MLTTMKKSVLTISAIIAASAVMAQSVDDALRFSQTYQQGTARSAAMGGAFGALGGDLSVLSTNPAGMSIYKDGEFSFTPCFGNITSNVKFNGFEKEDDKFNFKMGNIGFVTSHHNGNENGLSGFAFGMSFNRLSDFSENRRVYGRNNNGSLLDLWSSRAQFESPDDLYNHGLISELKANQCSLLEVTDSSRWTYQSIHDIAGRYDEYQEDVKTIKGGINSWDFAFSGVYAEKLFFGASIGIQTVNYKNLSTYSELDIDNFVDYDYWSLKEEQETRGSGVNFKAGLIYKPVNFLRFGAAIHSPTFYSLHEKYYGIMEAKYDYDPTVYESNPEDNAPSEYDYRCRTPFKAIFSGAFIVPNYGLVSVDYEYVDYSKCKFETNEEDNHLYDSDNDYIKDNFKATKNLRIGLEGLAGQVAIRAGYAMYSNPYKFIGDDIQRQIISAGLGFRGNDVYVDLTGTYHIYNTDCYLYEGNNPALYKLEKHSLYIMATIGFKF